MYSAAPRGEYYRLYREMFDASKHLPKAQRPKFVYAAAALYFDGEEPQRLPAEAAAMWTAWRSRVLLSRNARDKRLAGKEEPSDSSPLPPVTSQDSSENTPGDSSNYSGKTSSPAYSVSSENDGPDCTDPIQSEGSKGSKGSYPCYQSVGLISISGEQRPANAKQTPSKRQANGQANPKQKASPWLIAETGVPTVKRVMDAAQVNGWVHLQTEKGARLFLDINDGNDWMLPDGSKIRDWGWAAESFEENNRWEDYEDYED